MRKVFKPVRLFIPMLLLGCSLGFVACSDDEDEQKLPDEVTTESMYGDYLGKITSSSVSSSEGEDGEGEGTPEGTDISGTINNDTVYLENFPIKDIVMSVVKDENLTDQIVEAVGEVDYKIGYEPTLTSAKDSIKMALNPESLKLSIAIPSTTEGEEAQTLSIEVKVEAGEGAGYAVENGNVKFNFTATEVLLGEGEEQNPLPDFNATTFNCDMNQSRVTPHF